MVGTGIRGTSFLGKKLVEQYSDILEFVGLCDINPGRLELKTIEYASPIYTSHQIKEGSVVLNFKNDATVFIYDKLEGFEIAGDDSVFYPANAKIINRKQVVVHSDKVSNPVAVRYAWRNWVEGTLFSTNFLPVSSFRTDNWDNATLAKKLE